MLLICPSTILLHYTWCLHFLNLHCTFNSIFFFHLRCATTTRVYYTQHSTTFFVSLFYFLLVWMIRILNTISKMLKRTKNSACLYFHELPVKTIFETFFFSILFFTLLYMLFGAVQCLVYSVRTDKTIFIESINVGRDLGWNIIYYVFEGIGRKSLVLSDDDHYRAKRKILNKFYRLHK